MNSFLWLGLNSSSGKFWIDMNRFLSRKMYRNCTANVWMQLFIYEGAVRSACILRMICFFFYSCLMMKNFFCAKCQPTDHTTHRTRLTPWSETWRARWFHSFLFFRDLIVPVGSLTLIGAVSRHLPSKCDNFFEWIWWRRKRFAFSITHFTSSFSRKNLVTKLLGVWLTYEIRMISYSKKWQVRTVSK